MANEHENVFNADFQWDHHEWTPQKLSTDLSTGMDASVTDASYPGLLNYTGENGSTMGTPGEHQAAGQLALTHIDQSEVQQPDFMFNRFDHLNDFDPRSSTPAQVSVTSDPFFMNPFYSSSDLSLDMTASNFDEPMAMDTSNTDNLRHDDFLGNWRPHRSSLAGSLTSSTAFDPSSACPSPVSSQYLLTKHRSRVVRTSHPKHARNHKQRRLNHDVKGSFSEGHSSCSEAGGTPQHAVFGSTTVSDRAIAACELWISTHVGSYPPEMAMFGLSLAFDTSIESLRNWFSNRLNQTTDTQEQAMEISEQFQEGDSGYQSVTTTDFDVASKYQHNLKKCNKKKRRTAGDGPYACTSRCGARFKKKDAWRKHEEINYPQQLWFCNLGNCQSKPWAKRVRFRKDKFVEHLSKKHGHLNTSQKDLKAYRSQVHSKFSKKCLFRTCNEEFDSWKERIDHIAKHLEAYWDESQWRDVEETNTAEEDVIMQSETSDSEDDSDGVEDNTEDELDIPNTTRSTSQLGSGFAGGRRQQQQKPKQLQQQQQQQQLQQQQPLPSHQPPQPARPAMRHVSTLSTSSTSSVLHSGTFIKPALKPINTTADPSKRSSAVLSPVPTTALFTPQHASAGTFAKPVLRPVDPQKGPALFDCWTGERVSGT